MKGKIAFVAVLAILMPALALPVMAWQAAVAPELADAKPAIWPPYYDSNDWPELLVFKGVAVKDGKLAPAVFLVVDSDDSSFEHATIIIDGKSTDMTVTDIDRYPKNGAMVVTFKDGSLLLKRYQINYMDTLFVSGEYDSWQLNMRIVGNEPVYRIMDEPVYAEPPMPVGLPEIVE